jgi:hypothetical protein
MRLELVREIYRDEWERRDQLTASLSTPIGVVTGIGGAIALLLKDFHFADDWTTRAFSFCIGVAIAFLGAATYYLARSNHGYLYEKIPDPGELRAFHAELESYYERAGAEGEGVEKDFNEYLVQRYADAADKNSRNNISKAAYLYRAHQAITIALVAVALSVLPWMSEAVDREKEAQQTRILGPVNVRLKGGR